MSDLAMLSGQIEYQGEWGGMVVPQDRRMARFENVPKLNAVESEKAGRPIYENQVVLKVRHPGERDETAVAMKEHHKYEFPKAWAAFEAGQQPEAQGTPLAILFPQDPSIVQHMRACHVFTVEQLATLTAEGQRRIGMGVQGYVAQAQKFLDAAERAAPVHQMEAALRRRDEEIEALKTQLLALAQQSRMQGNPDTAPLPTRGRGRRAQVDNDYSAGMGAGIAMGVGISGTSQGDDE